MPFLARSLRLLAPALMILMMIAIAPARADEPALGAEDAEPRHELGVVRRVEPGETPDEQVVTVEITTGDAKGRPVSVIQRGTGPQGLELEVVPGDQVVVAGLPVEDAEELDWQIVDYQRATPLYGLLAATLVALLAIGGWRGLKTVLTLVTTLGLVAGVLLPLTLRGWSPLPLAVLLAMVVALVTTLLTSGLGRKTWAAVLGTSAATGLAAVLAAYCVTGVRLTGMVSEESLAAQAIGGAAINFPGLLAASMLVGALGVMLDLSLSIAAAVDELQAANPGLDRGALFQSGWQVGRDLLSTTSNTLLLAYLGGFLPVLLALGAQPPAWLRLPHLEALAGASTTLLVGLLGLAAAVPLTAAFAAFLAPAPARSYHRD